MFSKFAKIVLTAKALGEILKEKTESKAVDLAIQIKNFASKDPENVSSKDNLKSSLKEKTKLELFELINEVQHRAQINELQLKSFIKEKLTDLTNNVLLDSVELNDIRSEIAGLRAEIEDLKTKMSLQKK